MPRKVSKEPHPQKLPETTAERDRAKTEAAEAAKALAKKKVSVAEKAVAGTSKAKVT